MDITTQIWTFIGIASGLFVASIAIVITLFIWNRTESRSDYRHLDSQLTAIRDLIKSIQDEMKDFHGRLERQDAEFKGKLALQDAEFKAHLMYHEKRK